MASQSFLNLNPLQPPVADVEHLPLANKDFKIVDVVTDSNLLELHYWSDDKFIDQADDIHLWDSNLPKYAFPHTYQFRNLIRLCQINYFPNETSIFTPTQEIIFTMNAQSINQMLQIQPKLEGVPLSIETLIEFYLKLDFPKRSQIFQTFLLDLAQIPKKNRPYSAAMFPEQARKIVTMLSCIIGYFIDEHVDESILGFLSIFCSGQPLAITLNFAQFLADAVHDQLVKLLEEGVFKYSSVLFHIFLYFQSERFAVSLQKLDTKGNPQSVVFWISLIRKDPT